MVNVYILLGGNIGDTKAIFKQATSLLKDALGPVVKESSLYESPPWGFEATTSFLNQVLVFETECNPDETLQLCQNIENHLGRIRLENKVGYESRPIDIDILYYGNTCIDSHVLTIPHKQIPNRRFTLLPLQEIAPDFICPKNCKTNTELLNECTDVSIVEKL